MHEASNISLLHAGVSMIEVHRTRGEGLATVHTRRDLESVDGLLNPVDVPLDLPRVASLVAAVVRALVGVHTLPALRVEVTGSMSSLGAEGVEGQVAMALRAFLGLHGL